MALDRARAGDDGQFISANRRITDAYNSFLGTQVERDKFVRFADANSFSYTRQIFEARWVDRAGVAGNADGRACRARHCMWFESKFSDDVDHMRNLRIGRVGFHDN